uniref:(California timema) hypothetical protein n=1 Tax=Timema californicum TaxID=61474 RepID=A0A7R9JG60_TIMCA|nr:unnamed protein product [Timema californicum]
MLIRHCSTDPQPPTSEADTRKQETLISLTSVPVSVDELVALNSHIRVTRTGSTQLSHQNHGEFYKKLTEGLCRELVALNSHIRIHGEFYKKLTEGLCRELVQLNSHIRITSISPGVVDTEIFEVINPVNGKEKKEQLLQNNPFLNSKDISDAVLYTLGTPPHVQVHEIIIRPVGEKF